MGIRARRFSADRRRVRHIAVVVTFLLAISAGSWPGLARAQTLRDCTAAMDIRPIDTDRVAGACNPVGHDTALSPLDRSSAFAMTALALLHTGRPDEALEYGLRATELSPRYPYALGLVGMIYSGLRRPEDALKYADRAVGLDPKIGIGLAAMGTAHLILKQPELAAPALAASGVGADPSVRPRPGRPLSRRLGAAQWGLWMGQTAFVGPSTDYG